MSDFEPSDILIERVTSNVAGDEVWTAFERHAAAEPGAWERLARTLRDDLQIRAALDEALEPAEHVDMTDDVLSARWRRGPIVNRWSGWAIAALVALAWLSASFFNPARPINLNTAGLGNVGPVNLDETYRGYVDHGREQGRVLEELPSVMLELRAVDDGGVEVFFVRQLLERARIDSAWQMRRDDLGRQTLGPVNLASYERGEL